MDGKPAASAEGTARSAVRQTGAPGGMGADPAGEPDSAVRQTGAELAGPRPDGGAGWPEETAARPDGGMDEAAQPDWLEDAVRPADSPEGLARAMRRWTDGDSGEVWGPGISPSLHSGENERYGVHFGGGGLEWLYRQTARAQWRTAPAQDAVRMARQTQAQSGPAGLTVEELDRAVRRDSRRYDGEMLIF